jgi:hypothetical protein
MNISRRVIRTEPEAGHSSPSIFEDKNAWNNISMLAVYLKDSVLKSRSNLTIFGEEYKL